MIIARGNASDNCELLLLGLTRANVDKLMMGQPIRIRKDTHEGVPENLEVVILFGESEASLANLLTDRSEEGKEP